MDAHLLEDSGSAQAQETQHFEEQIHSFVSDLALQSDGSFRVTETIEYDFGQNVQHGIFRTIPLGFKAKGQPDHTKINVLGVTDENNIPYHFAVTSDDPLNIKIGDSDKFVTGLHTYVISYLVYASVGFFDTYDELYWNVTGDAWKVSMRSVKVTVQLPERVSLDKLQLAHYCGRAGEKKTCGIFSKGEEGGIAFATTLDSSIDPGEQISIAVGFPKGMILVPNKRDFIISFIRNYWFIPLPLLLIFLWFRKRLVHWQKRRQYYKANTIIAEYDPGPFDPLEAAVLVNGRAEFKDITAVIVSLAVQGHLKIENKDDEFLFTQIKSAGAENRAYEHALLNELDHKRESDLGMSFGKKATQAIKTTVTSLVARNYVSEKLLKSQSVPRFLPTFLAFFFAVNPGIFIWLLLGHGFGFAFSGACIFIGILNLFLKPKSVYLLDKGLEAERKLLGLRLYIQVAEEDRINFANAPAKTPELFEKLLPYAMVFGLEKKWAKEFEGIYTSPPSWYEGGTTAFSSLVFAESMSSLSSVTTQAIASSVLSSSRSSWGGSSGSGGGGSSGGGGGGGGGGSW